MVVSRYLVDWVVIGGLVVGTLRVMYLSTGFLGKRGGVLLQNVSLGLLVLLALFTRLFVGDFNAILLQATSGTLWWLILLSPFAVFLAYIALSGSGRFMCFILLFYFQVVIFLLVVLVSVYAVVFDHESVLLTSLRGLGSYALFLFTLIVIARTRTLSERQIQVTGLIFTLLGIATQFVPPILDLLNIPVR